MKKRDIAGTYINIGVIYRDQDKYAEALEKSFAALKIFKEIGDKYGPFKLAILECGQYHKDWPYIHMSPEQTFQAFIDLKGEYMLPVHWGKFSLSLHAWHDPVERLLTTVKNNSIKLITPEIGEILCVNENTRTEHWWKMANTQ